MSEAIAVHHGAFGRAALYELNRPFVTHAHREGHLICYVSGGNATVTVGDQPITIDDNTAVAVAPWEPHSFEKLSADDPCMCLVLYVKPMWFLENCQTAECVMDFGQPTIVVDDVIKRWILKLTALLLDQHDNEMLDGYLFEMTQVCYDQSWTSYKQRHTLGRPKSRFNDYRVRRSLRLMQEKFSEELTLEQVARDVGLSRPHFFKLFKRQVGITPNLYLNTLRAERAIKELMSTSKSVTDIGHDLGFSSQASFTRFFASNVGIPPSDYRRVAHRQ